MQNNIRIIHKHAVESVWNTKTSFVPYAGEVIIYDADDSYSYARFKIGDGETSIVDLPFSKTENSATADRLTTPRKIALAGDLTGIASFDGSSDITLTTTLNKAFTATFEGTSETHTHVFKGTPVELQISHEPAGSVVTKVKPTGSVEAPKINVSPKIKNLSVVTGDGASSSYTPGECVFPELLFEYDEVNNSLSLSLSEGRYTPGEYISGGALTKTNISYVESVDVTSEAPTFTGDEITINADLMGVKTYTTVEFTPAGTIEEKTQTPQGEIIINYE